MEPIKRHFKSNFWISSFFVILCASLGGCEDRKLTDIIDSAGCPIPIGYVFKAIEASEAYQLWQVRTSANRITWNGIDVTEQELAEFAQQLSKKPPEAGSVTFQVIDISCEQRTQVRRALSRSDLCNEGRCWEADHVVEAPIVHSQ